MVLPDHLSFNPHALPPLVTALFVFALGCMVVIREKGSRVSLFYLSYTLAVCAWLFPVSAALLMRSETDAFLLMKFANAGVTLIPATLYHFTVVVLQKEDLRKVRVRAAWAVSCFFLGMTLFSDVLFGGLYHYSWGIYLKFRPAALSFFLYFLAMTFETLRLYWIEYRQPGTDATRHGRAKAFLIAFSIGYLGTLDFLPALGVPYYPLSSVPMICMLALISRAIWQYRLVDITPAFAAREIIDTMNDALIVLDTGGIVRVVNRATCALVGRAERELVGRSPAGGMATSLTFALSLEAAAGRDPLQDFEVTCDMPDGSPRTVSLSTSIMRNPAGERVATVCLVNDISERRRAELERERLIVQLQQANEKLQSMDTLKSNIISMVSHELRTPLTTIKAFVELLLMKQGMSDGQKVKLMRTVNDETDRLARLITDLLDLSRIEAGSMKWQMADLSLEEVIRSVLASMEVLFENKGLQLTAELHPSLPRIRGDRDRLVQVVTNILSNAVKFTPRGGTIRVTLRQEAGPPAQIVAGFSDTGIGIPPAHIGLIFEKFHRSDDELTAAIEGSGLGLAITRQIVEYHGGNIWAESTQGAGSTFYVTLPPG